MNNEHAATRPIVPAPHVPADSAAARAGASPGRVATTPMSPAPGSLSGRLLDTGARFVAFAGRPHSLYQAAILRIGFGLFFVCFLLREWPNRRALFGDLNPWALDMARTLNADTQSFSILTWSGDRWWFELVYHGAIATAVLLMLGWRTRAISVFFLVGVLSIENRSPFVGDAGDDIIRIMAIYLVFTRCGQMWSLDARRYRMNAQHSRQNRAGPVMWLALGSLLLWSSVLHPHGWAAVFWVLWGMQGLCFAMERWFPRHGTRGLLTSGSAMLHNCAMLVIAAQVCFIYASAGLYKSQGFTWQNGSAVYYAMHIDLFRPWPWLSDLIAAHMLVVFVLCYATVIMQVAFPFTLGYRRIKNVLLPLMMLEHAGIAVILGIPFLSMIMMVSDAVFLPTAFLLWTSNRVTRLADWLKQSTNARHARPRQC